MVETKKKIYYILVSDTNIHSFKAQVNQKLEAGWELYGGLNITHHEIGKVGEYICYYREMITSSYEVYSRNLHMEFKNNKGETDEE